MATLIFPTLTNSQGYPVTRKEIWKSVVQEAWGGKETLFPAWSYPRHQWSMPFTVLRIGTLEGGTFNELQQLMGFVNSVNGAGIPFYYSDPDDNSVSSDVAINTNVPGSNLGDGTTTTFQLSRTMSGFVEPILNINVLTTVFVSGVPTGAFTLAANPSGIITFTSAPAASAPVTWTGTFYFLCRFVDDQIEFEKFVSGRYELKKLQWINLK